MLVTSCPGLNTPGHTRSHFRGALWGEAGADAPRCLSPAAPAPRSGPYPCSVRGGGLASPPPPAPLSLVVPGFRPSLAVWAPSHCPALCAPTTPLGHKLHASFLLPKKLWPFWGQHPIQGLSLGKDDAPEQVGVAGQLCPRRPCQQVPVHKSGPKGPAAEAEAPGNPRRHSKQGLDGPRRRVSAVSERTVTVQTSQASPNPRSGEVGGAGVFRAVIPGDRRVRLGAAGGARVTMSGRVGPSPATWRPGDKTADPAQQVGGGHPTWCRGWGWGWGVQPGWASGQGEAGSGSEHL